MKFKRERKTSGVEENANCSVRNMVSVLLLLLYLLEQKKLVSRKQLRKINLISYNRVFRPSHIGYYLCVSNYKHDYRVDIKINVIYARLDRIKHVTARLHTFSNTFVWSVFVIIENRLGKRKISISNKYPRTYEKHETCVCFIVICVMPGYEERGSQTKNSPTLKNHYESKAFVWGYINYLTNVQRR